MLERLGRYEILEELGRGAMGVIYKAKDPVIGRFVAVKTIRLGDFSAPGQIEELRSRLMREAQSAGVLSHPNIITIFDVGEEEGLSYFTMELVEGANLEHLIETGQRLDEAASVHIIRQAADALGFAHQRGIVHRDIKPANIMLTQDGRVKVADFGIAKVGSSKMTQTGMLLGSPSYMAPEHFLGQPLDGRSDIFALGIVMYELVTGQPPFNAENLGTLSYKIVHEDPIPPIKLKPGLNPKLNAIILKALARNPAQRFQTAEELCSALDDLNLPVPGSKSTQSLPLAKTIAMTAPKPRRRRAGYWLVVCALLLVGAGAIVAILYPEDFKRSIDSGKETIKPWIARLLRQPDVLAPPVEPQSPSAEPEPIATQVAPSPSSSEPPPPGETTGSAEVPMSGTDLNESPSAATTASPPESSQVELKSSPEESPVPSASTPNVVKPEPRPESLFGSVTIHSTPSDAEIAFDAKTETSWRTPHTFRNVPKGRHTLEVRKSGYVPERRIVLLLGNENQQINIVLTLAAGLLKISTIPAGAYIYVDGQLRREVTPSTIKLPAGARKIRLVKEGFQEVERMIEIEDNSIITLNQQLVPLPH